MTSRTLTTQQLTEAGASVEFVNAFQAQFGDTVEIDPQFLADHYQDDALDVTVLAAAVLSAPNAGLFAAASSVSYAAQGQAVAAAQAAYDAAIAPGLALIRYGLAQAFGKLYIDETPPPPPAPPPQEP